MAIGVIEKSLEKENNKKEVRNIWIIFIKILLSLLASILFSEHIAKSDNALSVIVNAFSILSGFLFLIITQSAALSIPVSRLNKIELRHQKTRFNQRFVRNTSLFISYLFVLLLIFIFFTIKDSGATKNISIYCCYLIVFLACFAFLSSLQLPWTMKALTIEESTIKAKITTSSSKS